MNTGRPLLTRGHLQKLPQQVNSRTSFHYEGREVAFQCVNSDDHILNIMRRRKTFYEIDVLERIRDRLNERESVGAALDIGAFIGTHSVYFSMFCGCQTVYSFEANPESFPILEGNLQRNGLEKAVFQKNLALGATPGRANILRGARNNIGTSSVDFVTNGTIEVSTVDDQVAANSVALGNVVLIKVDVEGAELEVLSGAKETVRSCSPILCIEAHTRENLREVLNLLADCQYWIVDCLGNSPTYILEPAKTSSLRRSMVNSLWLIRASSKSKIMKWFLRRLCQISTTGKWDPVSSR